MTLPSSRGLFLNTLLALNVILPWVASQDFRCHFSITAQAHLAWLIPSPRLLVPHK